MSEKLTDEEVDKIRVGLDPYDGNEGEVDRLCAQAKLANRAAHPETVRMREALQYAKDCIADLRGYLDPNHEDLQPYAGQAIYKAEAALSRAPKDAVKAGWLTREQIEAHRKNTETEPGNFLYRLCDMALAALDGRK